MPNPRDSIMMRRLRGATAVSLRRGRSKISTSRILSVSPMATMFARVRLRCSSWKFSLAESNVRRSRTSSSSRPGSALMVSM
jgi:hypothetical protein